jgi:cobalt-zinc-cadmium efflux system protein
MGDHEHHNHQHSPANFNRAFAVGILLNTLFVVAEVVAGLWSDSLALIADAGHNLSDVLSLLLAWAAAGLAQRAATRRHTYGLGRVTIMASMISSLALATTLGALAWEAVRRFQAPELADGQVMMLTAGIGVVINGLTAWLFAHGHDDLNIRAAFLHMLADALISAAVVVAGLAVVYTESTWIDPALTLLVVGIVFVGTWRLLRESLHLSLDGVPPALDVPSVEACLKKFEEVIALHDLHIWALSTSEVALTVHLVVRESAVPNRLLATIQQVLDKEFGIRHATIQLEWNEAVDHALDPQCL